MFQVQRNLYDNILFHKIGSTWNVNERLAMVSGDLDKGQQPSSACCEFPNVVFCSNRGMGGGHTHSHTHSIGNVIQTSWSRSAFRTIRGLKKDFL